MNARPRKAFSCRPGCLLGFLASLLLITLPALAQENAPSPTDQPVGVAFRWLNFLLVFGGIAYLIAKFGGPYFRGRAQAISGAIRHAAETHAGAERELREAAEHLAALDRKIQELRQDAQRESAAEAARIRNLAQSEVEKIGLAGRAEIEAVERAARQELRATAARLATERAAGMIRERMNKQAEAALFRSFVGELQGTAP